MSVIANFINLDGSIYSYMRYTFEEYQSKEAFETFFSLASSDAGYASLDLKYFALVTTNRDFDLNEYEEYFKDDDIDLIMEDDVIAKKGVVIKTNADLVDDCDDITFCRLFKENLIYSKFEFEGLLGDLQTRLETDVVDFELQTGVSYENSSIYMTLSGLSDENDLVTTLEGMMVTVTEDNRTVDLESVWHLGNDPSGNIIIFGEQLGIYDNVFNLGVIDMSDVTTNAVIYSDGTLSSFSLLGLGIYGYDCITNQQLYEDLQNQNSDEPDQVVNLEGEETNKDGSISIINEECKSSYVTYNFDRDSIDNNNIEGIIQFKNSEDMMRTFIELKNDDHVPDLVNNITFSYGLSFDYLYSESKVYTPIEFVGQMDFMLVPGSGRASLDLWNEKLLININLPTIKIGGGNVQLITTEDLFFLYDLDSDDNKNDYDAKNLQVLTDFDDLKEENTVKYEMEADHLSETLMLFETNILLFSMVDRASSYLQDDIISFNVTGNPFNGEFKAQTIIEVLPVESIEEETNSVMEMTLLESKELDKLESTTNTLLQEWVIRIVKVTEQAEKLKEKYSNDLLVAQASYTPVEDCETYEQCLELPTIICDEYAQIATCIEEQEICSHMVQTCTEQSEYCTRYNSDNVCLEYIVKCDLWENLCPDDEKSTVCLEFDSSDIPDQCLIMELSCDTSSQPDQQCVSDSQAADQEMQNLEDDIESLDKLLKEMEELSDSSICLIKRSDLNDPSANCEENDDGIYDFNEIEILDIFEISLIISNMQLNEVIASDSIIFDSDIWLYGDWTGEKDSYGDSLVENYELTIEEEQTENGYNSYAKSLVHVKHTIDYESIDVTAENLYNSIRSIVCLEFNIGETESDSIQSYLTEFGLVDGNATICPPYVELSDEGFSDGLYSDYSEETSTGVDAGDNELNTYVYSYDEGRTEIETSEEQIEDQNTLAYEDRDSEEPKDVTVNDAVLDDVEVEETETVTPTESDSEDLEIDNQDSRDDDELTDEEIEALEQEEELQAQEEDAEQTLEEQEAIDEQQEQVTQDAIDTINNNEVREQQEEEEEVEEEEIIVTEEVEEIEEPAEPEEIVVVEESYEPEEDSADSDVEFSTS